MDLFKYHARVAVCLLADMLGDYDQFISAVVSILLQTILFVRSARVSVCLITGSNQFVPAKECWTRAHVCLITCSNQFQTSFKPVCTY